MTTEVGAYEAKTKLPELLRGVQAGKRYTITHRGTAIAELVPVSGTGKHDSARAVDDMRRLMADHPIRGADIRALIEEGRS